MTEPAAPDERRRRRPRINPELRNDEGRVKPLELFVDLVCVLAAFALEEALPHLDEPLHTVPAFAFLLLASWSVAGEVDALVAVAIVIAVLWPMIAWETAHYDDTRYRLRHGLDVEPPGHGRA